MAKAPLTIAKVILRPMPAITAHTPKVTTMPQNNHKVCAGESDPRTTVTTYKKTAQANNAGAIRSHTLLNRCIDFQLLAIADETQNYVGLGGEYPTTPDLAVFVLCRQL